MKFCLYQEKVVSLTVLVSLLVSQSALAAWPFSAKSAPVAKSAPIENSFEMIELGEATRIKHRQEIEEQSNPYDLESQEEAGIQMVTTEVEAEAAKISATKTASNLTIKSVDSLQDANNSVDADLKLLIASRANDSDLKASVDAAKKNGFVGDAAKIAIKLAMTTSVGVALYYFGPAYLMIGIEKAFPIVWQQLFGPIPTGFSYYTVYLPAMKHLEGQVYMNSSPILVGAWSVGSISANFVVNKTVGAGQFVADQSMMAMQGLYSMVQVAGRLVWSLKKQNTSTLSESVNSEPANTVSQPANGEDCDDRAVRPTGADPLGVVPIGKEIKPYLDRL